MKIDEIPAGHELDAIVAEKVMGNAGLACMGYSESISAAWEIVEKFDFVYLYRASKDLTCMKMGQWECSFRPDSAETKRMFYAVADTAELAICRAALKAVGA